MNGQPQTIGDVIYQCHKCVPCGLSLDLAIEAHQQASTHPCETVRNHTLRTILMARAVTLDDDSRRLDYLAGLDVTAWEGFKRPSHEAQQGTLDMYRRQIAWQMQG